LTASAALADECASRPDQLDRSPRLSNIKNLFAEKNVVGFVNETRGSYFFLDASGEKFLVKFYTSGIFDLYGIHQDHVVSFCDDGQELSMDGLGRKEKVKVFGNHITLGAGGPRKSFAPGEMPELLKKLHGFEALSVAAESKP
jgi:hypothetical protein